MILVEILKEKGISKLQLALRCQIAPSDLYNAMNGNKPFFPKWRKKIATYLEVDENLIFDGNKLK